MGFARYLVVAVLAGSLIGCGRTSDPTTVTSGWTEVQIPADYYNSRLAATESEVVRIGGYDLPSSGSNAEARTPKRTVGILDLATGKEVVLPAWSIDGKPVQPIDASYLADDRIVVVGQTCRDHSEEGACSPGVLESAILHVGHRTWEPLDVPGHVHVPSESITIVPHTVPGMAVAIADASNQQGRVIRLTSGKWIDVGANVESTTRMCATSSTLFVLGVDGTGATPAKSMWIDQVDLETGHTTNGSVPGGILGLFGGAGMFLACDRESAYLASSAPATDSLPREGLSLWRSSGGGWDDITGKLPASLSPIGFRSAPDGVLLSAAHYRGDPDKRETFSYYLIHRDAAIRKDLPDFLEQTVWLGGSGDLMRIRPTSEGSTATLVGERLEVFR